MNTASTNQSCYSRLSTALTTSRGAFRETTEALHFNILLNVAGVTAFVVVSDMREEYGQAYTGHAMNSNGTGQTTDMDSITQFFWRI
jgi:hypothetical protein